MAKVGLAEPVVFNARKTRMAAAMLLYVFLVLMGLLLVAACYFTAREGMPGFSAVLGATGLLVLLTGGTSLRQYATMFGAAGPLLVLDKSGLADQRVLAGVLPWGGLHWWVEGFPGRNKSKIIVLVAPRYRAAIKPRSLVERIFGHDPASVIISMSGIGAQVAEVAAAMETFRPSSRLDPRDPNRGVWD